MKSDCKRDRTCLPLLISRSAQKQLVGGLIVFLAMLLLFLPSGSPYFVDGVFLSTVCMIGVALWLTEYSRLFRPTLRNLSIGILAAFALYGVFYGGNALIQSLKPLGIQTSNESAIYSLISSHQIALQIVILALDAVGFESYFRGTLQNRLAMSLKSKPVASVFLAAFVDSAIHLVSLNPLWVITTFVADSVWGLTYFYTKDLSSSIASHFLWDVVIFVFLPIS
jgi:membrane protease YdiL (CAAX protease family)